MSSVPLFCHPSTPAAYVVTADVDTADREWIFRYRIEGNVSGLRLPGRKPPVFAEALWHTTCFEAFIKRRETRAYYEFNFSPSEEWALYQFNDYRQGMIALKSAHPPRIQYRRTAGRLDVEARVPAKLPNLDTAELQVGVAAVLESSDGRVSYWSLMHPAGKPDFHQSGSFALILPPAAGDVG